MKQIWFNKLSLLPDRLWESIAGEFQHEICDLHTQIFPDTVGIFYSTFTDVRKMNNKFGLYITTFFYFVQLYALGFAVLAKANMPLT